MPQRAGAKGSITGTTACLLGPAVQHNLGASARDSSKWLPGAWRALTCSTSFTVGLLTCFPAQCESIILTRVLRLPHWGIWEEAFRYGRVL